MLKELPLRLCAFAVLVFVVGILVVTFLTYLVILLVFMAEFIYGLMGAGGFG